MAEDITELLTVEDMKRYIRFLEDRVEELTTQLKKERSREYED